MSTAAYLGGRKKYSRPQAMLWSDNPGVVEQFGNESFYVPLGREIGSESHSGDNEYELSEFLILTDDNRQPIDFSTERIESRQRTVNGRMRSYHIADKLTISTSWTMVPSRSATRVPSFDDSTGLNDLADQKDLFTTDGGAGGAEMLDWYENHQGSFWVFLSYDKYPNFGKDDASYENLNKYSQVIEVYFADFSYTVVKRGGSNYDFWDISVSLEEV
jgi:hypothetical protein